MKVLNGIIFLVLFIFSCSPPVVFDQAYPLDGENLEAIPDSYQGTYICESDSALVTILPDQITLRSEHYFKMPIRDVLEKEGCTIEGEKMYVAGRQECIPLEYVNDSIVKGIVIEEDIMFAIDSTSFVRLHKGHVVLSQELEDGNWAISLLTLQRNSDIIFKAITDKTKIETVERITPTKEITTASDRKPRYQIKPTMKEFDKLLSNKHVFIECEYLSRVQLYIY